MTLKNGQVQVLIAQENSTYHRWHVLTLKILHQDQNQERDQEDIKKI